ncbi:Leucyl/phenylalanyl-tRNA--protein transferase [compost metagenome]
MFTRKRDASKVCLAYLVEHLNRQGFVLLDTQFTTAHLERFGAIEVKRKKYEVLLEQALQGNATF